MKHLRGKWEQQIENAWTYSPFAVEVSALANKELEPLVSYLSGRPRLPFRYLSVHGPSKGESLETEELFALLLELAPLCDGIVMHPDRLTDLAMCRRLGRTLILENMDARKHFGQGVGDLAQLFDELPAAGFCFDIAHAWSVDPSMTLGNAFLDTFGERLRQVHLSSLSDGLHHVSLTEGDEQLFRPLLGRCVDVPWILEASPAPSG